MDDQIRIWAEQIRAAGSAGGKLRPRGGGSKDFYGRTPLGDVLDTRPYQGVASFEPTELVVTVRAGTPLAELEATVAGAGQMLAFEAPHFGPGATVGGAVAAGLSGPRRAAAGSLRDFVLGVKLLDGRGEVLSFGGQVMKNVAGYDVSRLMAGSLGTLGLILEVSLKVLPRPVAEATLKFELDETAALRRLNEWGGLPLPISASAWEGGVLHLRLSGAGAAVDAAWRRLGGARLAPPEAEALWQGLREQTAPFFQTEAPLWRLSLPSLAPPLALGPQLVEWGGAQRWLASALPAEEVRRQVAAVGGHATLFRGGERNGAVFTPLPPTLLAIHRRLKQAFDPAGVFSPGRMYPEF
ncbi:MAG: glycolate oxidase subunit GlcE [Rhodocyclaceae bacterium]|nr:glycolate oxidase subunit GlcE [Rhodocyclaceae bacterium]